MEQSHNIQQLPPELRCMIWSEVGQAESYTSLFRTSRLIRSDIIALIPGAGLSCQCSPYKPCTCGKYIYIKRLNITVEPNCSTRSWLKFSVSMLRGQGPSWKVGSLDDILAQALRYLRPREISIDFQAPKKGNYQFSLLILRAKLFDVCSVLNLVQAQKERSLHLHFSDPWATSGGGPNKPFWENRPCSKKVHRDDIRRMYRRYDPNLKMRMIEKREAFLYFYETIVTPFCMHWAWRNAKVTFDKEPNPKSTTFVSRILVGGQKKVKYHGIKALLLTAWAFTERLVQQGLIKESEDECVPEIENHQVLRQQWTSQELQHDSWKRTLQWYLNFVLFSSIKYEDIMQYRRLQEEGDLAKVIWGHFDLSARNSFSKLHPTSFIAAGSLDRVVASTWTWSRDSIRQNYRIWSRVLMIRSAYYSISAKRAESEPDYGSEILFNEAFEAASRDTHGYPVRYGSLLEDPGYCIL